MELGLEGRRALVTGASRGIGAAVAVELAREGADVALLARDRAALNGVAARVEALGRRSSTIAADLRDPATADMAASRAAEAMGGIDILVNCAGDVRTADAIDGEDADWQDGFSLKLFGAVRLCRAAWPYLVSRQGVVMNIAGLAARAPRAGYAVGAAVNAALLAYTRALADRGRREGVRVLAINPGHVRTDRLGRALDAAAARRGATPDQMEARALERAGVARFAEPEEIGRLCAFLASPAAAYVHGAAIDIDGGAT